MSSTIIRRLAKAPVKLAVRAKSTGDVAVRRSNGGQLARRGRGGAPSTWGQPSLLDFNPFAPINRIREQMDRVFDDVLVPMVGSRMLGLPRFDRMEREADQLMQRTLGFSDIAIDIAEKADEYVLTAEMPGVSKDNLRVEVDEEEGLLTITAEKSLSVDEPASTKQTSKDNGGGQQASSGAAGEANREQASANASGSTKDQTAGSLTKQEGGTAVSEREQSDLTWHRTERAFGTVTRIIRLPGDADYQGISAKLDNGVLTMHIPKRANAEPESGRKRIEIQ